MEIVFLHPLWPFLLPLSRFSFESLLLEMINAAQCNEVELALVTDAVIAAQNQQFMHLRGPTNILSFPQENGGALQLSLDTLQRESFFYGQNPAEHLCRLLAHGLAHLKGYDHGSEMERIEQQIFIQGLKFLNNLH